MSDKDAKPASDETPDKEPTRGEAPKKPSKPFNAGPLLNIGGAVAVLVLAYLIGWVWMIERVSVEPGEYLIVTAKFGATNPDPENLLVVPPDTQGIQEAVIAEGRHFYNPFFYDTEIARVIDIEPGKIAVVKSLSGEPLPSGEFLAEPGQKGILREPLSPGRYRLNPYAYEYNVVEAVEIQPGFVGCVTARSGRERAPGTLAEPGEKGIQRTVLQPGIYYLNPREYEVAEIEIGYRHIYLPSVSFQSKGYEIDLDMSVVWGLRPENVPYIVQQVEANLEKVGEKIFLPAIESIARLEGSKFAVKDFLEGDRREEFQAAVTDRLKEEARKQNIEVLIALVRDIKIPQQIATPIQQSKIDAEEVRTKQIEQLTTEAANELERVKEDVVKGVREVRATTERLVAETLAVGTKRVAVIEAETERRVAEIERRIAEQEALRTQVLGEAEARVKKMLGEAASRRLALNVSALGGADAYTRLTFAKMLPPGFRVFLRYAGPGTLWTDLSSLDDLADLEILRDGASAEP